jgi:hypothetical protein
MVAMKAERKAGKNVFMESQHFLLYGHSATTEI